MKTSVKLFCLCLSLLSLASGATGQTLTVLTNFNGGNGANPQAGLVASGGTLYGTAYAGGNSNFGTVFAINTNGTGLTNVYSFNGAIYNVNTQSYATTDGANPAGGLVLSGNMLYGTTSAGGSSDAGTVFAVNTNGGNYAILHNFSGGSDGSDPEAGLVLSGNMLYGTTFLGGTAGDGAVFGVSTTNGGVFTNLHSFSGGTNGSNPEAGLVLSGNTLYGTTYGPYEGGSGFGTVFKVNTDGSGFSNVYSFSGGGDGAYPEAGLVLSGGTLYGTANGGGLFGNGTVFSVNTNGSGFQSYVFNYTDGANPAAGLLLVGNMLYGTATNGGASGWGTVFQVNTNGNGFTDLYAFTDGSDGAIPEAGLVLLGATLYGTTQAGDAYGYGTVFALTVPSLVIPLSIALNGGQVTLSWTNAAFSLQSAPTVNGVFTNVPGAASPYTNAATGKQQFFRLQN